MADAAQVPSERSTAYCQAATYALYTDTDPTKPSSFCDIRLICSDIDAADLPAHRFILALRSKYFREMLYGRRGDSVQENCKVNKHYKFPAPANVLRCILEYLYTGSILALESADSFQSQGGQDLWQRLLKVATTHSMGGLDRYLSSLLAAFPVDSFAAAAHRFSFALDLKLPNVMAAMAVKMSALPLDADAFEEMSEEALILVLQDVRLDAPETVVCQAVQTWVEANLYAEDGQVPSNIMDHLNLKYISMAELENVIEPMGMFGSNALFQAYKMHALYTPQVYTTRVNEERGQANKDWYAMEDALLADSMEEDFLGGGNAPCDVIEEESFMGSETSSDPSGFSSPAPHRIRTP